MSKRRMQLDTPTQLVFPPTWNADSCARFMRLYDAGKMTQAEVDRVEARLVEFRRLRDEFAAQPASVRHVKVYKAA